MNDFMRIDTLLEESNESSPLVKSRVADLRATNEENMIKDNTLIINE
jgi:hypothetical protein